MGMVAGLWKIVTIWYVSAVVMVGLGVLGGWLFFVNVFPGKPFVGVIDIPFTPLNDESASAIGEMLDYAERTASIKAVVIKLASPGGGVAASEGLYLKVLRLREKKPVVISAGSTMASGGYMMAVPANYIYSKPASFVGSIGVALTLGRQGTPSERVVTTGPAKLAGASARTFTTMIEMMKQHFVQLVVAQRGDRLSIGPDELAEGRLYLGMEGVRLGLVDAIGTDTDAIEKAADLAGISHYGMVDVNEKVLRRCVEQVRQLLSPSDEKEPDLVLPGISCAQRVLPAAQSREISVDPPSGFPFDLNMPQMYYLYVAPPE